MSWGPGNRGWTPGHPQQAGFPCQMLLCVLLGCHPSAPRSPSSMSLEQLWGLDRLLCELTQWCDNCSVEDSRENACVSHRCATQFPLMTLLIILLLFSSLTTESAIRKMKLLLVPFSEFRCCLSRRPCSHGNGRVQCILSAAHNPIGKLPWFPGANVLMLVSV